MITKMHKVGYRLTSILALGLTAFLLLLAVAPAGAWAHAEITSSTPAAGSTVQAGMTQMTLHFTEAISPDQSSAQLVGPGGSAMSGVTSAVDRADRTVMNITTPALSEGKYTIKWAAVTEDDNGHTNGEIAFTVAASGTASTTGSTSGSGSSSGSSSGGGSSSLPTTGAGSDWSLAIVTLVMAVASLAAGVALRRRASV
jgi:methionine-rich copper-binding protein CopC